MQDLRDFIRALEEQNELVRIKTEVSRDLEISEIYFRQIRSPGGGKALLFENVTGSKMPVLINAFGSENRIQIALNRRKPTGNDNQMLSEIQAELRKLLGLLQLKPPKSPMDLLNLAGSAASILRYPPKKVRFRKAPVQSIVLTGDQIDLDEIPILKSWPLDAGRFITLGMTMTRSLDGKNKNLGLYRIQILDKKTAIMHWQIHKDGSNFFSEYRKAGVRMPVSVVFGGDPSIAFSGIAPLPPKMYELLLAGFIRGKGVPVVKGITNDLEVPADAEIILEGYVDPEDFADEGPFGDHTGYYTPVEPFPRFHITAVTMRPDPIYPATVVGRSPQEDCYLARAVERLFLPMLQFIAPEVTDQMLPWDGCFHNCAVLSVEKHFPFQARKLMNHLWGFSQMSFSKSLIMVDSQMNLHGPGSVLLDHILDRVNLSTDVVITEGVLDQLDHSGIQPLFGGKIGVDVTTKWEEEKIGDAKSPNAKKPGPAAGAAVRKTILSAIGKSIDLEIKSERIYGASLANPVWIIALNKQKSHGKLADEFAAILNKKEDPGVRIVLLIDGKDDPSNDSLVLWKMFGNTDPIRDIRFTSSENLPRIAIIDSTSKNKADGYDRSWPKENMMDASTIKLVSSKWKEMFGVEAPTVERP